MNKKVSNKIVYLNFILALSGCASRLGLFQER